MPPGPGPAAFRRGARCGSQAGSIGRVLAAVGIGRSPTEVGTPQPGTRPVGHGQPAVHAARGAPPHCHCWSRLVPDRPFVRATVTRLTRRASKLREESSAVRARPVPSSRSRPVRSSLTSQKSARNDARAARAWRNTCHIATRDCHARPPGAPPSLGTGRHAGAVARWKGARLTRPEESQAHRTGEVCVRLPACGGRGQGRTHGHAPGAWSV